MSGTKKLPIGIEFFKDFKTDHFYYVDKTGFIRDLLQNRGSANLFTRPRRFGKSLNMDMLKCFFEIGANPELFENLEIMDSPELCERHMGKYPVVSITLKDVEGKDFKSAYDTLCMTVSAEAERFDCLLDSEKLTSYDKAKLIRLIEGDLHKAAYLQGSLKLLTRLLSKHYEKPVIVLIDEYDVPLDKAYQNGYYSEMVSLIRLLFSQVLKTNPSLYFAVITGCLRIGKESIFTGLNNFKVRTISDEDCAQYFGFTRGEVQNMLAYYGVEDRFQDMKEWYDGYRFGSVEVYCPWDVINQCDKLRIRRDAPMEPHWENSSSNGIIQDLLQNATETTKAEMEALISGEYVEKQLIPELTYTDLENKDLAIRQTYLWSVLFATGYLTDLQPPNGRVHRLIIPNREVRGIYENRIRSWFKIQVTGNTERWEKFCEALQSGDAVAVKNIFQEFLSDSISIRDTFVKKEMKENFYHGMLLGLLSAEGNWAVKSNAESGIGYTDIQIEIPAEKIGCIIEVKYAEKGQFASACREAMEQIDHGNYTEVLKQNGMQIIHKYGIACYKKSCDILYSFEQCV